MNPTAQGYEIAEGQLATWLLYRGLAEARLRAHLETVRIKTVYGDNAPDFCKGALACFQEFLARHGLPFVHQT